MAGLAGASTAAHHPRAFGPVERTFARHALPHGTSETASTAMTLRPDSGYNATVWWAYDDFTRTVSMSRQAPVSGTFCGLAAAHACYRWLASFSDHGGTFQTIQGNDSPGFFNRILAVTERGTFSGTQQEIVYDSYASAFPGDVPMAENDNGQTDGTSSTRWPCFFFGGAGFCHPQGASTFSYSYAVAAGADTRCPAGHWHWTDSTAGNVASTGDILAPRAPCSATPNT
jgi:hypothetical protein